jgi:hypothetical protein
MDEKEYSLKQHHDGVNKTSITSNKRAASRITRVLYHKRMEQGQMISNIKYKGRGGRRTD